MSDFDPTPRNDESLELFKHRLTEGILSEDWLLRLQANIAGYTALGDELATVTDPEVILNITEQKGASLTRAIGSGGIHLWQLDVQRTREQFEADFGFGIE